MCLLAPTTKALESSAGSTIPLSRGYKLGDTGIVNIIIIVGLLLYRTVPGEPVRPLMEMEGTAREK